MKSTLTRVGGIRTDASPIGGRLSSVATPVGGMTVTAGGENRLSCRMFQACKVNVRMNYLEIRPTIVWMLAGWTENEVISNTTWIVR